MNVHVNQVIGGIFGLALMERFKGTNGTVDEYSQNFMSALPVLVMPSALQHFERAEKVFFIRNDRIPYRKYNYSTYPRVPFGEKKRNPAKDIEFLDKEINIELFQTYNFRHSGYHLLKAHLLVRQELYKLFSSLVIVKKRGDKMFYRVCHDGTELTAEEMENEISIFEEAVLIYIADVMQSRHNFCDCKSVSDFCYKQIEKHAANISDAWLEEMLTTISLPDKVQKFLAEEDYSLKKFESKICFDLEYDVARFVSRAYELVYHEF